MEHWQTTAIREPDASARIAPLLDVSVCGARIGAAAGLQWAWKSVPIVTHPSSCYGPLGASSRICRAPTSHRGTMTGASLTGACALQWVAITGISKLQLPFIS